MTCDIYVCAVCPLTVMWQIETTVSMSRFVQLPPHLFLVVLLLSLLCCCAYCTGCNVCMDPACSPAKTLKRTGQHAEQHNQRPQNDRKWNHMHWYTKIFSHVQLTWTGTFICGCARWSSRLRSGSRIFCHVDSTSWGSIQKQHKPWFPLGLIKYSDTVAHSCFK